MKKQIPTKRNYTITGKPVLISTATNNRNRQAVDIKIVFAAYRPQDVDIYARTTIIQTFSRNSKKILKLVNVLKTAYNIDYIPEIKSRQKLPCSIRGILLKSLYKV